MNRCDAVFFCFFVLFLLWIDRTAYDGIDMTLKKPLLIELFLFYFQVPSWPSRRWRAFLSRNDYLAFVNQKPEIISSKRIKVHKQAVRGVRVYQMNLNKDHICQWYCQRCWIRFNHYVTQRNSFTICTKKTPLLITHTQTHTQVNNIDFLIVSVYVNITHVFIMLFMMQFQSF